MKNDAGDWVLGVSLDGAAFDAVGVEAVVATHGQIVAEGVGIGSAFEFADTTPVDVVGIAVLFVAGDFAGAAADALGHVEVKTVLFALLEDALGDQGVDHARRRSGLEQRQAHEIEAVAVVWRDRGVEVASAISFGVR